MEYLAQRLTYMTTSIPETWIDICLTPTLINAGKTTVNHVQNFWDIFTGVQLSVYNSNNF